MNIFKKHTEKLLIYLAKNFGQVKNDKLMIGVSGAHGKTTTILALKSIMDHKEKTAAATNLDSKNASNLSLTDISSLSFKAGRSGEKIIVEISDTLDIDKDFDSLVKLGLLAITGVDATTDDRQKIAQILDRYNSLLAKLDETGLVVINWENSNLRRLGETSKAICMYYGLNPQECHIWAGNIKTNQYGSVFELNCGVERVEVRTKLLGLGNISSLLCASACAVAMKYPLTAIKKGLEKLEVLPDRMELLDGHAGSVILNDSLYSDPETWDDGLEVLNQLPARRRIVVVGEMKGLKEASDRLHRRLAQQIYKSRVDIVLTGQGEAQLVSDELVKLGFLHERVESNMSNPALVSKLLKILGRGDIVLVKGDYASRLDEVVKKLQVRK